MGTTLPRHRLRPLRPADRSAGAVGAGIGQPDASEDRLGRSALRHMIEHRIFGRAAIGHQHQQRKLVTLGQRDHAGAHAEHARHSEQTSPCARRRAGCRRRSPALPLRGSRAPAAWPAPARCEREFRPASCPARQRGAETKTLEVSRIGRRPMGVRRLPTDVVINCSP